MEAVELLQESKQIDQKSSGCVADYSEKLIDLYQKLKMEKEYKEELMFQIFQCKRASLENTGKLKEVCTKEEWETYRERLISGEAGWSIRYPLIEKEGLYERLLEEITAAASIFSLDKYEKVLKKRFPEQVRNLYIAYVRNQAKQVSDRKSYKFLVSYLKKIEKYPKGKEAASELASEWRGVYNRRPAMLDELKKAGY